MINQCFLVIFLFLSYLLSMCSSVTEPAPTPVSFKTTIASVKDCSNPFKPFLKNSSMSYYASVQNIDGKNMLLGNLTVLRDTKDFKINIKVFVWRNGKWHQTNTFNNMNCHGVMLHISLSATGVNYDKKKCVFLKGSYVFQNLDVNQLQHIWVRTLPPGRQKCRIEAFSKDGMFICKEFESIVESVSNA